jgi:UrcA family protein
MTMRTLTIALAAMLASPAPLAAQMAPSDLRTAPVVIGDLNLASAPGMKTLERRVARALEEVCSSYVNAVELGEEMQVTKCRRTARADFDRQLAARQFGSVTVLAMRGDR